MLDPCCCVKIGLIGLCEVNEAETDQTLECHSSFKGDERS